MSSDQTLFGTSAAYEGITMSKDIVYYFGMMAVTALSMYAAKGPHGYGAGKKESTGEPPATFGSYHYWYRWFDSAAWAPHWAWMLMLVLVCASSGLGMAFLEWIVNDYTNAYWISLISFFLIIPPIEGSLWAVTLFIGKTFTGAAVVATFWFATAAVNFSLAIVYPIYFPQSLPNWTYQWLAMGLGTIVMLIWSFYVFVISWMLVYYNNGRDMKTHRATGESRMERTAAESIAINIEKAGVLAMSSPALLEKENALAAAQQIQAEMNASASQTALLMAQLQRPTNGIL